MQKHEVSLEYMLPCVQLLAHIDMDNHMVHFFDSLPAAAADRRYQATFRLLQCWLQKQAQDCHDLPSSRRGLLNSASVKMDVNPVVHGSPVPLQPNSCDCGVYTMLCARFLSAGKPCDYNAAVIERFFRPIMALEIVAGRLCDPTQIWKDSDT